MDTRSYIAKSHWKVQGCNCTPEWLTWMITVLVKSFAHLNRNFFLASLEEIGKLWKSKLAPSLRGSQKIHSIKCAKLLTSTVLCVLTYLFKATTWCLCLKYVAPRANQPIEHNCLWLCNQYWHHWWWNALWTPSGRIKVITMGKSFTSAPSNGMLFHCHMHSH